MFWVLAFCQSKRQWRHRLALDYKLSWWTIYIINWVNKTKIILLSFSLFSSAAILLIWNIIDWSFHLLFLGWCPELFWCRVPRFPEPHGRVSFWPFHSQDLISNSPYCLPFSSYDVSLENLGSVGLNPLINTFLCRGLASHPGGRSDTPSCSMLVGNQDKLGWVCQ